MSFSLYFVSGITKDVFAGYFCGYFTVFKVDNLFVLSIFRL